MLQFFCFRHPTIILRILLLGLDRRAARALQIIHRIYNSYFHIQRFFLFLQIPLPSFKPPLQSQAGCDWRRSSFSLWRIERYTSLFGCLEQIRIFQTWLQWWFRIWRKAEIEILDIIWWILKGFVHFVRILYQ